MVKSKLQSNIKPISSSSSKKINRKLSHSGTKNKSKINPRRNKSQKMYKSTKKTNSPTRKNIN